MELKELLKYLRARHIKIEKIVTNYDEDECSKQGRLDEIEEIIAYIENIIRPDTTGKIIERNYEQLRKKGVIKEEAM